MEDNEIILNEFTSISAVNADINKKVGFTNKSIEVNNGNINSIVDVAQVFEDERNTSTNYRIYGTINYVSLLSNLSFNYNTSDIKELFIEQNRIDKRSSEYKKLDLTFDVYVAKYANENIAFADGNFERQYEILSKFKDIELVNCAFSSTIFNDTILNFISTKIFNVGDDIDSFGKPIMDLFLFFVYKTDTNKGETTQRRSVSDGGNVSIVDLPYQTYDIGDIVNGDYVEYEKEQFLEIVHTEMKHFITLDFSPNNVVFEFNPFIPLKLRDYEDVFRKANSGSTDITSGEVTIPNYATPIDNQGNFIWKNILFNGYVDPVSGNGTDHPFLNNSHYVFNNIIFPIRPNFSDASTLSLFDQILFDNNTLIGHQPNNDPNIVNKNC